MSHESDRDAIDKRILRVVELIGGFETPYGLELLATVHWVVHNEGATTFQQVVERVQGWNERKRRVMKPEHLRMTLERLREEFWVPESVRKTRHAVTVVHTEAAFESVCEATFLQGGYVCVDRDDFDTERVIFPNEASKCYDPNFRMAKE